MENQKQWLGQPRGLFYLFFTELWERFSFYGMKALLVLFLVRSVSDANPGYGWSSADAQVLLGTYGFLVYLSSIPGGILADKWLGQKKSVFVGGLLLVAGHSILAVHGLWAFYTGLALIIAGVGCLKPNISTMVGGLYKQGDNRRDKGFTIFYIGINTGAFLATVIVGYVGEIYNWHYGFGLAGIGMLIGLLVFVQGQKYLKGIGEAPEAVTSKSAVKHDTPLTRIEKDRIIVMLISFLLIIVFWGAFEQGGGLLNLYAEQKTNRMIDFLNFQVPATWFQSLNPLFIMTLGVPVAAFWYNWATKGKESSSILKMAIGVIIMGWGFLFMAAASLQYQNQGSSAMYWLVLAYLFHTVGELCASPVALSYVTKLAPVKYGSIMMGIYFAATGLGNYVAGWVGAWSQTAGELEIFIGIAVFCTATGLLVLLALKPLKRLAHGAEDRSEEISGIQNTEQIEVKPA
jgi:proton-dependent oligopeptide transporter, POT family